MGHTVKYWYDVINAEKNSMSTLNGLQPAIDDEQTLLADVATPSKVAHWRLFTYVIAYAFWMLETLWDMFQAVVEAIIAKFRPGTLHWYQEQAFAFQDGYELEWDAVERKYKYATIDTDAKIVKLCSVQEVSGVVRIKAATLDGTDVIALSSIQLARLQAYFNLVKYPGSLVCVSYDADVLKIYGIVKFNPLVDETAIREAVEDAINGYLKGFEVNDRFNGKFNINALIDKVQALGGVEDFTQVRVYTKYGQLAYQQVTDEYQMYAGYAEVDSVNFPLANTLTYQLYV